MLINSIKYILAIMAYTQLRNTYTSLFLEHKDIKQWE